MNNFKENNENFIKSLKAGLKVCEPGSIVDINYTGIQCAVSLELHIDSKLSDITKKVLVMCISAWRQSVALHYEDPDKINIHIKITYNEDGTFTEVNSLNGDDILNQINFDDEEA